MPTNRPSEDAAETTPRELRRERVGWMPILLGVAGLAVVVLIVYALVPGAGTSPAASTNSLAISNQMSTILEVNPVMTLGTPAPSFSLTDQNGRRESLSTFSGKAVVLTFGDDKCTDLCTLLAEDVLAANRDLGSNASRVQFVSINANTFYPSVAATKSWTTVHGLGHATNWHFLTGSPSTLTRLADKYGVDVALHAKTRTIDHGAEMFFISPNGDEEQIGDFGTESANTAEFSHSMAQLATEMLPVADRRAVGGPTGATVQNGDTAIGSTPPPIELPTLGSGTLRTTSAYRGKYVVLNFWSPTCGICVHELPALESVHRSLGLSATIVGIDVADPTGAGTRFASRLGATYPMLSDAQGVVAAQYEIPGSPYTVILDPRGKVVVRHPGEMTAEQVDYVLHTLIGEAPRG